MADIGMIGLGVMGANIALNMAQKGYGVAVFDPFPAVVEAFAQEKATGNDIVVCRGIEALVGALSAPRTIMLMVKAGEPVDDLVDALLPHLAQGDILIDGGNSYFEDTVARVNRCAEAGVLFVGAGVSGGAKGALHGPSIMVGGNPAAWPAVQGVLTAISAKAPDGHPCCAWVGNMGAGHYVKMVHNGIEYAVMQAICESYLLMREGYGMPADEIGKVFAQWHKDGMGSFLMDITADILQQKENGVPVVDTILDSAGQKGTGRWSSEQALYLGVPAPTITEAVFARCLSSLHTQRGVAAKVLPGQTTVAALPTLAQLKAALFGATLVAYVQGFALLHQASAHYGWEIDLAGVAGIWEAGCIIQADFLREITTAFTQKPGLENLLLAPWFVQAFKAALPGMRQTVVYAALSGAPAAVHFSALGYYDSYRTKRLPTNLLQAQRDYFGAHTYQLLGDESGAFHHRQW